jgi:hypothetical protein
MRTLITPAEAGTLGPFRIDDFSMKLQLLCFHRANGANNHVQEDDAVFFTRNTVGVTYDHLIAMLTK